jgi:hypothetical protein
VRLRLARCRALVLAARADGILAVLYKSAPSRSPSRELEVVPAFEFRDTLRHEWLFALTGVVSILFGLVFVMRPGESALAVGIAIARSTVGATELSESRVTRHHPTSLNEAECASPDAVLSISHPGGRRFESD